MGKFTDSEGDIFSVFGSSAWKGEGIETQPSNYTSPEAWTEYIRVNILCNGTGPNKVSVSGILIVDIFTPAGQGPSRATLIADKLEDYLSCKSLQTAGQGVTQFQSGSLSPIGTDKDNQTLFRSSYTIPFTYFGVS